MQKLQITEPADYLFTVTLNTRITDLNYGNHVGNDAWVSLLHEARMQFLHSFGYTEMNMEGSSLIMAGLSLQFGKELLYPMDFRIHIGIGDTSAVGFELKYKIERRLNNGWEKAGMALTTMICYDYDAGKVVRLPESLKEKWKLQ